MTSDVAKFKLEYALLMLSCGRIEEAHLHIVAALDYFTDSRIMEEDC